MSTNKSQLLDDATQVGLLIGAEFNQNSVLRPKLDTSESFNKQENRMKRKSLAESKVDMVTIKIIRAWDLFEALGGTNAYVIVDWGKFGRSSTQAVVNSVDPYFGATLRFKSPFRKADDADIISNLGKDMVSIKGEVYYSTACPIRVYLYHRNESIVDELLGEAEVDPIDVATIEGTSVLYLYDRISKSNAGCLELSMLLN